MDWTFLLWVGAAVVGLVTVLSLVLFLANGGNGTPTSVAHDQQHQTSDGAELNANEMQSADLDQVVKESQAGLSRWMQRVQTTRSSTSEYELAHPPKPTPVFLPPPALSSLPLPPDQPDGDQLHTQPGVHPISFALHSSVRPAFKTQREWVVAPCVPGKRQTYVFRHEQHYFEQYSNSWFGLTCKKSGWDCLRHYEIAACGAIPVFMDLEAMPSTCMMNWNRRLLTQSRNLYARLSRTE